MRDSFLRRALRDVTPPFIGRRVGLYGQQRAPHPEPDSYSTLDDPVEVPCQVEAYLFCRDHYIRDGDSVLDVGFGLGFGLHIMAAKAGRLSGIEVDSAAAQRGGRVFEGHPRVGSVALYDGLTVPMADNSVDVVTCVDVIEHVEDYESLLGEMIRVARRRVFLATPNRRPECTLADGSPKKLLPPGRVDLGRT